nr:MAG TPA: hypothetical protein [Bacteriophage sp.]
MRTIYRSQFPLSFFSNNIIIRIRMRTLIYNLS